MERLTYEADFGLQDWEETLFPVPGDSYGAYNILDIAKHQGNPEFDETLKNISLRLSQIEDVLGKEYDLDRLRELVKACKGLDPREIEESKFLIATQKDPVKLARLRELLKLWLNSGDKGEKTMKKYVSVDDIFDVLYPVDPECDGSDGCTVVLQNLTYSSADIEGLIDQIPAADVAPVVHGKWERISEDKYRCSNCGRITRVDECMGKPMYIGCPYCMAKMDVKE